MSLINDALKRAEAAQQQTPPPPADHLPLRPVDPQVAVTHGIGLALPVVFAATALLLLFFVWRFYMDRNRRTENSLTAAARTESPQEVVQLNPASSGPPAIVIAQPVPPSAPTNSPAAAPAPVAVETSGSNAAVALATISPAAPDSTNPAAATDPPLPKLPPLKLQGVVCSKTRPSAVISGKTVFLGDRIREFRVVNIGVETVTLAGGGRTNVLVMSD